MSGEVGLGSPAKPQDVTQVQQARDEAVTCRQSPGAAVSVPRCVHVPAVPTGPQPTTELKRIIDKVRESAHHRELQIRSAPGFCGGVDGAADAGSEVQEVVPRRAESEHGSDENALQHARMVIARLSAALKLSEAELVRLRDDNSKLRMLLRKRTANETEDARQTEQRSVPSFNRLKRRKVSAPSTSTVLLAMLQAGPLYQRHPVSRSAVVRKVHTVTHTPKPC